MRFAPFAAILAAVALASAVYAAPDVKTGEVVPSKLESPHPITSPWLYDVNVAEAGTLRLHLAGLRLNQGDQLVLSDGLGKEVYTLAGPYAGALWLPQTSGEWCRVEIWPGKDSAPWGLQADWLSYGYPAYRAAGAPAPESICGVDDSKDAVCYQSDTAKWTAGKAVARVYFSDPVNGSGYCTGFILSPYGYFITNNHCIATEVGAQSVRLDWEYQNQSCGAGPSSTDSTTFGAHLVATDFTLDYALLAITSDTPQARYGYLTPNPVLPSAGDTIWIAGHPGAQPKRFSVYSDMDNGNAKVQAVNIQGNAQGTDIGYYADTQNGSSGSPVMLGTDNSVVALHHFGLSGSTCTSTDMNQGVEMAKIYPQISAYLSHPYFSVAATAAPMTGSVPLTVSFSAALTGGTSPFTYTWDFGDGSATSASQAPQHTYTTAGTYAVKVTVQDSASVTATDTHLSITATSVAALTATASSGTASGTIPLAVQFTGTASGGVTPYTYSWNFGDGSALSSAQNPAHTYTAAGTYGVTLTVHDSAGASAADSHLVITASKPAVPPPVITAVKKATNPFRLILTGTNFHANCTIKIDGTAVPLTTFKTSTKVVAKKGAALKAMLPSGHAVSVTVTNNDDGGVSAPFGFTRTAVPAVPPGEPALALVPPHAKAGPAAPLM